MSIACILIVSSLLIYIVVMTAMPKSYQVQEDSRFSTAVDQFIEQLQNVSREDAIPMIDRFCLQHNTTAYLKIGDENLQFGAFEQSSENVDGNLAATKASYTPVTFTGADGPYLLLITRSMQTVNAISVAFYRIFPWILVLILLVSAVGAWICSALLSKPVLEICMISKRMSKLDLTWRCSVERTDELGVLAANLNTMADKLTANTEALETANMCLQGDVEREREQERQRRALFAAVSHELKTPITILRGQLESMIYGIGAYKDRDKFLPISLDTVNRMEGLVKEILLVSKLTSDEIQLHYSLLNLRRLLQDCCTFYEPLAAEKEIHFEMTEMQEVVIEADEKRFKKVLSNLIGNAVAYSPEGACVRITLTEKELTVENTGVWIPEDQICHIFEPFYRIEQSRNKNTGGNGLGLYIVKIILELHKMAFSFINTESGVRFSILIRGQE